MKKGDGSVTLPLRLRRDRGYVYFPDAIAGCIRLFGAPAAGVLAECYRSSNRQIVAEPIADGPFDFRAAGVFGRISWGGRDGNRQLVLLESPLPNEDVYDLVEPSLDIEIEGACLAARVPDRAFPSVFHRWAVLCKKLFHHAEPAPVMRMLILRMATTEDLTAPALADETVRLRLSTKDRFLKFEICQGGVRVGEVIAMGRRFG